MKVRRRFSGLDVTLPKYRFFLSYNQYCFCLGRFRHNSDVLLEIVNFDMTKMAEKTIIRLSRSPNSITIIYHTFEGSLRDKVAIELTGSYLLILSGLL